MSEVTLYPSSGEGVTSIHREVLSRSWGATVGHMRLLATEGIQRQFWYCSRSSPPPLPSSGPVNKPTLIEAPSLVCCYSGTSLIRNSPSPQDHHRALGIGLL